MFELLIFWILYFGDETFAFPSSIHGFSFISGYHQKMKRDKRNKIDLYVHNLFIIRLISFSIYFYRYCGPLLKTA